jgi:ABC-type transport system involved in multi-copper enzyme maturation permease subunit
MRAWLALAWDVPLRLWRGRVLGPIVLVLVVFIVGTLARLDVQPKDDGSSSVTLYGTEMHSPEAKSPGEAKSPEQILADYLAILYVGFGAATLLVPALLVATSDAITRAFLPGAAEPLLTKPLARHEIVLARAAGAIALTTSLLVLLLGSATVGAWLRTKILCPGVLAAIPILALAFAILHAMGSVTGTALKNPLFGILGGLGALTLSFVLWGMNLLATNYLDVGTRRPVYESSVWITQKLRFIYARPDELLFLAGRIAAGQRFDAAHDGWLLVNGAIWLVVAYGAVVVIARNRDY